mgnify:CR=1 FL=1
METFVGEIRRFAGNFALHNRAFCSGQFLSISQNSALFSILGTTYGGDGCSPFALLDLHGRIPIQLGRGVGLSTPLLGQPLGIKHNVLHAPQLPSHTHAATGAGKVKDDGPDNDSPTGHNFANVSDDSFMTVPPDSFMAADSAQVNVFPKGQNQPVNNMQPSLGICSIILMQGNYPPVN